VDIGSSSGQIDEFRIYADVARLEGELSLLDLATGGTFRLNISYDSAGGATADRSLRINTGNGNRVLTLNGNLTIGGGPVTLTAPSALPGSSVTLPETGTLATLAGTETLTNKTISGAANTLTSIAYSSLILTGSVTDSDISTSAAISRAKVAAATPGHVLINDGAGLLSSEEHLSKSRGGLGIDASALTIPVSGTLVTEDEVQVLTNKSISGSSNTITDVVYSSLVLTGELTNSDIATDAAISYAKLALTNSVTDSDIATSADISRAKLAAGTAGHVVINDGSGELTSEAQLAIERGGTGASTAEAALSNLLPDQSGNSGKFLATDGSTPSWVTVSGSGTVTSVGLSLPASLLTVTESPVTISGNLVAELATQSANLIFAGPSSAGPDAVPTFRALTTDDLPTGILDSYTTDELSEGVTNLYHTDSRAVDAVVATLADSTSVDLTYAGGEISAEVIPGGVDHDLLSGYVANEHIDHSSVSVETSATSGLSGGGDLTATRSLSVDPMAATAATPELSDIILFADVSNSNVLRRTTLGSILSTGGGKYMDTWETADGTSISITHGFGTRDVSVSLYDLDSQADIQVDSIVRTDDNTVQLTASAAPSGTGWRVIIRN
jgi:hypothetical protein